MERTISALLVEDNPGDADLVSHYLDNPTVDAFLDEVTLTHVESLAAGRSALDEGSWDVILLDLGLPESTGIETVRQVSDADPDAPIIVLTGLEDAAVAIEAVREGAQDFLPKGDLDGDRLARSLRYAIDRHEQERQLSRQNERMDFFNSVLRHDMMNGLNVIMAQSEMLASELADPEHRERAESIGEWSEDIHDLARKVRSVLQTVTDDGSRTLEPVSLSRVVETQADRVRSVADRVSFEVDAPDAAVVLANELLEDVVGNLLMNAVEHSEGETTVRVSVTEAESRVLLTVADDGPGIPRDRRSDVFDRGQKGQGSRGTGFGLYFVSSMVESYDGSVGVTESDAGGAAFEVDLPAA